MSDRGAKAIPMVPEVLGVDRRTHNEFSRGKLNSSLHVCVRLLFEKLNLDEREYSRLESKVNRFDRLFSPIPASKLNRHSRGGGNPAPATT